MSINTSQYSLIPVRRDKQIGSSITIIGGSSAGSSSPTPYDDSGLYAYVDGSLGRRDGHIMSSDSSIVRIYDRVSSSDASISKLERDSTSFDASIGRIRGDLN